VISGLVLAAGSSSRFGSTKQLFEFDGKALVLHAVDNLRAGGTGEILVVTGHDAERVEALLPDDARPVRNDRYRDGLSTSLAAGLHAVGDASEGAVVLMADQPGVSADDVRALIHGFRSSRGRMVRLRYEDGPGPALLSREIYGEAGHLSGDAGARLLEASHPEWIVDIGLPRARPRDIDAPNDVVGC
jgi:molybdenum cofactor cytidylyltransferase